MTVLPLRQFATLSTVSVELPPRDEAEKNRLEELTDQIQVFGFRALRSALDWGYVPYNSNSGEAIPLQSGMLVKIFKTVTEADLLLELDDIHMDFSEYHHGFPVGISKEKWIELISTEAPAKLTKTDGRVIYGALHAFAETGTEGHIWTVYEYDKGGYEGLNMIEAGDNLQVFKNVRAGEVLWEGHICFNEEDVHDTEYGEVIRDPTHMSLEEWRKLSYGRHPAIIMLEGT